MNTWGSMTLLAVVLAASPHSDPAVRSQIASRPCVAASGSQLVLRPVDEGPRRSDFVEFRRRLQSIAARRDESALLALTDPAIKVDFDGSGGAAAFRDQHVRNPEEDFWTEFAQILSWGGSFSPPTAFTAPYVFANWPQGADGFECLAVVGSRVRVRSLPSLQAPIVAVVDYAIVQALQDEPALRGELDWQRVRLADGRMGYIARRLVRSPVDHRALFDFKNGQWWLVTYIAGD